MNAHTSRRAELLFKIVEDLLTEGAGDLSLRPLADRVGTSARLLIYHFGSKEELLAAALTEVRREVKEKLSGRARLMSPTSFRSLILMFWEWAVEEGHQRYFRLLFEVDGLALFDRVLFSSETQKANSAIWTTMIARSAAAMPDAGRMEPASTTLLMCATKGLLQEFLATGDREGTTAALETLLDAASLPSHDVTLLQGTVE